MDAMTMLNLKGLTEKEARDALFRFGKNEILKKKKNSSFIRFVNHFKNPLIFILLFAAVLSGVFGESRSAILIIFILLISTLLNYFQEERSGNAAEKLQEKLSLHSVVIRDGVKKVIKAEKIVPGDLVFLLAGSIVPADGQIISSESLYVDESVLTGESYPVEKSADEKNFLVNAGTTVISGFAYFKVEATGSHTAFGKIAVNASEPQEIDAFEKGVNSFGLLIVKTTALVVFLVFLIIVFKPLIFHLPFDQSYFIEALIFALAIAVGLTPELLPMIMSINMAKGSLRMAKKGVIVKRLNAIPDFGSIDILCTDKTGTLTEDRITLVKYLDLDGNEYEPVLKYAYLNSAMQTGYRNTLDAAILNFRHLKTSGYSKIKEIPYDFSRKRVSVVVRNEMSHEIITKGQPDEILKVATSFLENENEKQIDSKFLKKFNGLYQKLSEDGYKVLTVAKKKLDKKATYSEKDENDLTLVGFVAFFDPPKQTAAETVKTLERYGVEVKIITGDNEWVAKMICSELGIKVKGMMVGDEIRELDEAKLAKKAESTTIFARFSPEQKRRVIAALRGRNHVVGYLGDGINDAPSLKAADIGISVSNGADVAKETADIILSHKSLKELGEGIIEGRKTFGNTLKYLMMGLSSNFGNMFSLIGAAVALPFLPILPYQVLLNNSLYDFSQTTITSDQVDPEYLKKPKKWDFHFMKKFMIVFGLLSSVFDLTTFFVLYQVFHLHAAAFQTGWFIESLATQTLVIFSIRTQKLFWKSRPGSWVMVSAILIVLIGFSLPYTALGSYFSFEPLSLQVIAAIIAIIATYLMIVESVKIVFYRRFFREAK